MANKRIFSKEDIPKIEEKYKNGEKLKNIAKEYNASYGGLCKFLKKNNFNFDYIYPKTSKYDGLNILEIKKRYENGEKLKDIAKKHNGSYPGLYHFLQKNNFKFDHVYQNARKYDLDEYYLDKIDTQEKAYFLGFMYADGNVVKKGNTISFILQEQDKDILIKFKKLFSSNRPLIKNNRRNRQIHYIFSITSKRLKQKLIKYNCPPAKTEILTYPDFLPSELENHFIRGYFDGDGCFYCGKNKNAKSKRVRVSIVGSKSFCLGLINILKNRGRKTSLGKDVYANGNVIIIYLYGNSNVSNFMDWIYSDATIYLERKYNKYVEFRKWYHNYVQTMDKKHLYLKKKYEDYLKSSSFSFTN